MRVLTIGLGGAGSHISDKMLELDRRGEVHCIEGIAVDSDADELASLTTIPVNRRLFFSPLDPVHSDRYRGPRSQGGDSHPPPSDGRRRYRCPVSLLRTRGIDGIRRSRSRFFPEKSLLEPLFGICTLPRRSEGDICLAHAADQLDSLLEVLDGIIIFDNEAWSEKIPATIAPEPEKEIDVIAGRLLEKIRPEIPKNNRCLPRRHGYSYRKKNGATAPCRRILSPRPR